VKTSSRRIGWIILAGFVAAAMLPSLYLFDLLRRAQDALDGCRSDIASVTKDIPVRKSTRPAILGPAEAGNAWDLLRPALDAVGDLYPINPAGSSYSETSDPNLDWRGVPGETPLLIEQATPAMELCRRALRRSELEWTWPMDPDLPAKTGRIGRALCTKAAYAWKAGRDSEAAEWLVVALGVAQDAARLGQRGAWEVLCVVERWTIAEARLLLAKHELTLQDLALFGRRLDVLRRARPSYGLALRICEARLLEEILTGQAYVHQTDKDGGFDFVLLDKTAGWRDLYSKTILRARVISGIRRGMHDIAAVDWKVPAVSRAEFDRIVTGLAEPESHLIAESNPVQMEEACLVRRSMFRAAVAFAQFQEEWGRFPTSAQEAGLPADLGHPLNIKEREIDGLSGGTIEMDLVWSIGRRTKD
jgi:hypothetical protein